MKIILFLILATLNVFDWWQTRSLFFHNQLIELNPLLSWMIVHYGIDSILYFKIIILIIVLIVTLKIKNSNLVIKYLTFATLLYFILAIYHIVLYYMI